MNKRLSRYIPQIITGIFFLTLITGIYFPIGYIGLNSREPRDTFFIALDHGALFWGTLTFILTFAVYALVKTEKYLIGLFVVFVWCISAMILYISLSDLNPRHTDIAIYENKKQENLLLQYYETGVTGNPRNRLIKTKNMNSGIREYEEMHSASGLDSLRLYDFDFEDRIPKVLFAKSDTFYLMRIHNPWKNNKRQYNL